MPGISDCLATRRRSCGDGDIEANMPRQRGAAAPAQPADVFEGTRQAQPFELSAPPQPAAAPRPGLFRRYVLPYIPICAVLVTTVGAYFSVRNYLFLDARATTKLIRRQTPLLTQAHQVIMMQLASIQARLGLNSTLPPTSAGDVAGVLD